MIDLGGGLGGVVALSEAHLFGLPLPELWYVALFFLLGMFLWLDGFDFGIGALFLLRDDEAERERMLATVGPFWDGNEVWLIVFGGAMFAAFPPVYAKLFSRHYLLMFAILGALILRGVAPEMYEQRHDPTWQRYWGLAFGIGSILAPFFLGVFAGNWLLGSPGSLTLGGMVVGLAIVSLTIVDGAAFLALNNPGDLRVDATRYGTYALVAYLVLVVVTLVYLLGTQPALSAALLTAPGIGLVVATLVLAGVYVWAMREGRHHAAFAAVAALVFGLVTLVAWLMYPLVDPATDLALGSAIVSPLPLNLMTIMMVLLLPMALTYFGVLYSAFSGPVEAGEGY